MEENSWTMTGENSKRKYVTCFPGARDAYQLPYTLSKNNRLDLFITDLYNKKPFSDLLPTSFRSKLAKRMMEGDAIPHELISVHPEVIARRKVIDLFHHKAKASVIEDDMYAHLAVEAARKHRAGLFLYEFQAETAFRQKFSHNIAKHVFYFHPHPSFEHPILLADAEKYPSFKKEVLDNTRQSFGKRFSEHTKGSWVHADHIFVASSFTKRSIVEAGADPGKITVAPYGLTMPPVRRVQNPTNDQPYFLFVGSGSHRKGLHHLLEAWTRSGLSEKGKLVVVSRVIDDFNSELIMKTSGVVWKRGVSQAELVDLYNNASLFVLPSMSEGFGHVYLEALSYGCPVLGTDHSVLADIHHVGDVVTKIQPGNIEQLSSALTDLWNKQPGLNAQIRERAASIGKQFTWANFQNIIETTLQKFD